MQHYIDMLQKLKESDNYRTLPDAGTLQLLDLCSNDYMGIGSNAKMQETFWKEVAAKHSFGSCSSRLLGKNLEQHQLLETEIADAFHKEACLLFNSGYHANAGILPALASDKDLILADKLVHASIIDGAKLGKAGFMRYRHLDYNHLENLLKKHRSNYNRVFIASESIFSMDGDIADLHKLVDLKQKYNGLLYLDEAHALGVRGNKGLGCAEEQNCLSDLDFIVGTMGKAWASMGAFVVCKQVFKETLINFSRPFIYSTALPPINVAWSRFVFQNLIGMNAERQYLKRLSREFAGMLNIQSESHIIPFVIGSNAEAIAKSMLLKEYGFNALPVRYPTVPVNTARLRFSLSASMKMEQLLPIQNLLGIASGNYTQNFGESRKILTMEKHWIKRENNSKLILFFNGWGMDAAAVEHMDASGYDLLMFNNYIELNTIVENLDGYHEILVVAWSLGVWAASQVLCKSKIQIKQSIALNGTVTPVDDKEGIPAAIFKGTLDGWSEKTRERFLMRMAGGAKEYLKNQSKFGSRSIENQKSELDSIYNQCSSSEKSSFAFNKAVIGNQDAIFTPDNQRKSWQGKAQLKTLDIPHFPFVHFNSWEQIISV